MFKIVDEVENRSGAEISLTPYARMHRYGTPKIENNWILHEGLIGVIGAQGEQRSKYADALEEPPRSFEPATGGWLGFTDKYWASTVIPDQTAAVSRARSTAQAPNCRASSRPIRPTTCATPSRWRRARPARSNRSCSPAPSR